VGALLTVLAMSLLTLYSSDAYSQGQQQHAIQAYWNARSGVERYCESRQLPASGIYDFGTLGNCTVREEAEDLWFQGEYNGQRRRIVLQNGDPALKREEPQ
jgi:type II secretory pathway component PulK